MVTDRKVSSAWLAARSILWTLLLPGVVAGYVPCRYFGFEPARLITTSPIALASLSCVAGGSFLLAACIVQFARSGRGTLSPLDPPSELVVSGLYRHVRNPMYLGVSTILAGEALVARSSALTEYLLFWFLGANVFVIGYEEPHLRRQFGAAYGAYTKRVGRWVPRFRREGA